VKIVIVGPAFPLRGGIAHHVYHITKALRERGHRTEIISYSRLFPEFLFPGKTMVDCSQEALEVDALQVLDLMNPWTWLRATIAIRSLEPDLVLFEWWTSALAPLIGTMARLLRLAGLNCAFECHNIFPHEYTPLDFPLVHYGLAAADAFIVFSKKNQLYLSEYFPDRRSFYTTLLAPFRFPGNGRREGATILFFGMVRPYKGLDVLLQAMQTVVSKVQCKLIIAGEFYEPVDKYTEMVSRLGLEPFVELEDRYVPNEQIAALLDRADVLVLPYHNATQSGVLRMAMSSGLPVIASEVGALADEVANDINGLLVKAGDPVALSAALIRYFKEGLGPKFVKNMPLPDAKADALELVNIVESVASAPRSTA